MQTLSTDQLISLCKSFKWNRAIKQLHIHHTYKPDHSDYNGNNGLQLQQGMKDYHTKVNGWADIGQHLTLLPDGQWVTGRDFNMDPASIRDWNKGAFAIEMVGNFDTGHDKFGPKQAQEMFRFCAFFVQFKGLIVDNDVKFHRDSPTAYKTCPGTGIDRNWFMNALKEEMKPKALTLNDAIDIWHKVGVVGAEGDMKLDFVKGELSPKRFEAFLIKSAKYIKEKGLI